MTSPGPEPAVPAAPVGRTAPAGDAVPADRSVPAGRVAPVVPAATRWLRRGLDVLLVGLVALAVAGALVTSTARGVGAVLLGAALLALYVLGRRRVPVPSTRAPRGAWWPAGAWVTGLVALWVGLSLVSTTAVWVAFL